VAAKAKDGSDIRLMCPGCGFDFKPDFAQGHIHGDVTCPMCLQHIGEARFEASGVGAMEAQTAIVTAHINADLRRRIAQNCLAASFVLVAGICVLFAPTGRELAAEIIAGSFVIIGAGIAGFANLKLKTPHVEIAASNSLRTSADQRDKTNSYSSQPRGPGGRFTSPTNNTGAIGKTDDRS
jgi:hypothetical protein